MSERHTKTFPESRLVTVAVFGVGGDSSAADYEDIAMKVNDLAPGAWHTLTLKFDGINLDGEISGTKFSATDKVFEREKGGVDFLLTGGKAGFRNFSITPAGALQSPVGHTTPK